jgi:hypothetical protein
LHDKQAGLFFKKFCENLSIFLWKKIDFFTGVYLGMLSKLFIRKSLTKRNEFPFVEALGLFIRNKLSVAEMFPFLNEFRNENLLDLMRMLPNHLIAIRFILPNANVHGVLKQNPFR